MDEAALGGQTDRIWACVPAWCSLLDPHGLLEVAVAGVAWHRLL